MKFDLSKYNLENINLTELGISNVEIKPELEKLVTFQPNSNIPRHNWFYYKQGFSHSLVDYYIDRFELEPGSCLLDPFLGVGTTSLVAKNRGMNSFGFDILPINILWSNVKIRDYDYSKKEFVEQLDRIIRRARLLKHSKEAFPDVHIVKKGLDKSTGEDLLKLKEIIISIDDYRLRDFFLASLASIVDKASKTTKDGGFLRIIENKRQVNVYNEFKIKSLEIIKDLYPDRDLSSFFPQNGTETLTRSKETKHSIQIGDARNLSTIPSDSISGIITSPPYLNKTDYTRLYCLELYLIFLKEFTELREIRYKSFRSHVEAKEHKNSKETHKFIPDIVFTKIEEMKKNRLPNQKDPDMALGYFEDITLSLLEMKRILETGKSAAIVVWNARLSGVGFPVDTITAKIGLKIGFDDISLHIARLKGMSVQQVRKYGENPLRESVIILRK